MSESDRLPSWHRPPEVESLLVMGSLGLFGYVTYVVLWETIPPENEKYAMMMLVALIGVVKDTFGRFFQATKGSQEQRKDAAKLADKAADTAATLAQVQAGAPQVQPEGTATITTAPDVDVTLRKADETPEPTSRTRWVTENPEDPA